MFKKICFHRLTRRGRASVVTLLERTLTKAREDDPDEALGVPSEQHVDVGRSVGHQIRATLAGAVVQMSKSVGVTPWTVAQSFPRFWGRLFVATLLCFLVARVALRCAE